MKYFINLSTRAKLMLSFGLILLMFTAVIIIAYRSIKDITQSEKDLRDVNFQIALDLFQLRSHQNHQAMRMLEMMLVTEKSDQEAKEQDVRERSKMVDEILRRLDKIDTDPDNRKKLLEFKNILEEFRQTREKVISLIYQGKLNEAKALRFDFQIQREEKMRAINTEMGDKAGNAINAQLALDMQEAHTSTILFLMLGITAFLFGVIIVVLLYRTISKPLNAIAGIASGITGRNDLDVAFPFQERTDEVGILSKAFRSMVENLRKSTTDIAESKRLEEELRTYRDQLEELVKTRTAAIANILTEVKETVNVLVSSTSEILAATTQVASSAAETATAISETTTTVEEVRQAAQLSSQKASRVSENSQQITQVTLTGQKAVDETINGMHHIQNQMESIANTIVRLSEQSQQIGGIIASVNDVADQSNLLAVNAAIKAAKAGEQGKGFAVVAQEIKSLAFQSKQATIQVRNILSDVQKATSAAVMATEQGSKAVENGVKQSTQAGESIRLLSQSVNESVQAATLIVASSQQQAVGMDQIGLAMNNVNQASAENAASMLQAERAAKDMHDLGQKLKQMVEKYKE
jgi:methyl-accepting chemotaxis protein